ncbi:TonB-dependent receptor plug domain-containing protein [Novosphingobium album (ex Liu et al. 2023)]|uniref:TonB-dependent receptor n=1 Tax=Novosphingobium album (ex Liu et al. 2023) TaxID=3031130 RepID=A0ABT5WX50_9SPHN|nr:TonB-dependent receptor [Novosphingobium album (ex Liu et al. 2023)]MDE8654480.1 TonB-dependent receptor [Novosphingobium album (ex Liu et al. 2023)]
MTTFKTLLLAGLASSALAISTASAQDIPPPDAASPKDEPQDADGIVVTGSRIARPELESPMPVSVTKMEDSFNLGIINAYDALRRDPALGNGLDSSVGCVDCNTGTDTGLGALNLRNLGVNRTLTLVDGQRRVSVLAGASAVDPNMIPVGMIDRFEVVTGGAAAVYGADAVTGAVNIITKKSIEGLNLRVTGGIAEKGDATRFMASLATGGKFADDRGSFAIGGTYSGTNPFFFKDRIGIGNQLAYVANPKNTGPNDGIPDNIVSHNFRYIYLDWKPSIWINNANYNNAEFYIENGGLRRAQYDTQWVYAQTSNGDGGDGRSLIDVGQFQARTRTASLMGRLNYKLTDTIEYGANFSYAHVDWQSDSLYFRVDNRSANYPKANFENPYTPQAVRDFMTENGLTEIGVRRAYDNFPVKVLNREQEDVTIAQNISGKLGSKLNWQAFWQYGRARLDAISRNNVAYSLWINAIDVVADANGNPMCRSAAARADGCLPINVFSTDAVDPAVYKYFQRDRHEIKINTQEIYGGNINGQIFSLPYGDVSIAAGIEHRKDAIDTKDDPAAYLITSGSEPPHPNVKASMNVTEFYGEVVVPVLKDIPFIKSLEVEGAYRYSDYSTFGGTEAWKGGVTWSPVDWLTFRGVRSRSVRAPNFSELYTPQSQAGAGTTPDACDVQRYNLTPTRAANCKALGINTPLPLNFDTYIVSGGNPDLQPEVSNSLTLGAIFQPRFIPGLDVTADYWDIDIKNVIASFSNTKTIELCVDLPTIDNAFCDAVVRRPTDHSVDYVKSVLINASRQRARGIDFGLDYHRPLGAGTLSLAFKGTYLISNLLESTPGIVAGNVRYDGDSGNPRFRATLLTAYHIGKFGVSFDTQFRSATNVNVNSTSDEQYDDYSIPAYVLNNLALQFDITDEYQIGFGVNNIFGVKAPNYPGTYASTIFDQVGRYFYGSISLKL